MSFRINLEIFRGPLDLLLYLVRKHEVDIFDIPIALITDQYCAHLEILEELDIDSVGEFLDLASTLVEIKSRSVLPRNDEEVGEIEDPRNELVQRLLEINHRFFQSISYELGRVNVVMLQKLRRRALYWRHFPVCRRQVPNESLFAIFLFLLDSHQCFEGLSLLSPSFLKFSQFCQVFSRYQFFGTNSQKIQIQVIAKWQRYLKFVIPRFCHISVDLVVEDPVDV